MKGAANNLEVGRTTQALGSGGAAIIPAVDIIALVTTITGIAAMAAISFVYLVL